jgi:hypothetical protein
MTTTTTTTTTKSESGVPLYILDEKKEKCTPEVFQKVFKKYLESEKDRYSDELLEHLEKVAIPMTDKQTFETFQTPEKLLQESKTKTEDSKERKPRKNKKKKKKKQWKIKAKAQKKLDFDTNLIVGSYNVTATFFTEPDPLKSEDPKTKMPQHHWENRKIYFPRLLEKIKIDVLGLQELSPEQALDFLEMFPSTKYKFYFFVQAQTKDVVAGSIYSTSEEIKTKLLGKNIGTALIGIMYNPEKVKPQSDPGMFWYNQDPWKPPTATDRSETDKGFGNMNTPRGPGYVEFLHLESKKSFYFFTSHAPISGGWKTRMECFKLENKIIQQLTGAVKPFFSCGDRNLFPEDGEKETYVALVPKGVYDWVHDTQNTHQGFRSTWLGFLYEPEKFQNQIDTEGKFKLPGRLDIGTSSEKSLWSAHYHNIIQAEDVVPLGKLSPKDNETRNFLSDHAMLVAGFRL